MAGAGSSHRKHPYLLAELLGLSHIHDILCITMLIYVDLKCTWHMINDNCFMFFDAVSSTL